MPDGHDTNPLRDSPAVAPSRGRRLTDKILVPFHQACDQGDLEVAEKLLRVVELMLARPVYAPDPEQRKNKESLVAAYERLWLLRHPEAKDQ